MKSDKDMVSECANPTCRAPFLYLRDGKLIATRSQTADERSRVEYFWLCASCASQLNMVPAIDGKINLVPFRESGHRGLSPR